MIVYLPKRGVKILLEFYWKMRSDKRKSGRGGCREVELSSSKIGEKAFLYLKLRRNFHYKNGQGVILGMVSALLILDNQPIILSFSRSTDSPRRFFINKTETAAS